MSDYNVKECPCEACKKVRAAEQGQYDHECNSTCASDGCVCECHYPAPAQPPAGDVVERMCEAFDNEGGTYNYRQAMAAALAVAQQERDAQWEKAIRHDMPSEFTDLGIDTFVATLRARLAKPAEQTDEQKVEVILVNALKKLSTLGNGEHPGNSIGNEIAQKALTDAIRLREELKAGKQ